LKTGAAKVTGKLLFGGNLVSEVVFLVSESVLLIIVFEFKHFSPSKVHKLKKHLIDAKRVFGLDKISLGRV
jgi:hypothetical protein